MSFIFSQAAQAVESLRTAAFKPETGLGLLNRIVHLPFHVTVDTLYQNMGWTQLWFRTCDRTVGKGEKSRFYTHDAIFNHACRFVSWPREISHPWCSREQCDFVNKFHYLSVIFKFMCICPKQANHGETQNHSRKQAVDLESSPNLMSMPYRWEGVRVKRQKW